MVLLPSLAHVRHIQVVARLTHAGLARYLNAAVLLAAPTQDEASLSPIPRGTVRWIGADRARRAATRHRLVHRPTGTPSADRSWGRALIVRHARDGRPILIEDDPRLRRTPSGQDLSERPDTRVAPARCSRLTGDYWPGNRSARSRATTCRSSDVTGPGAGVIWPGGGAPTSGMSRIDLASMFVDELDHSPKCSGRVCQARRNSRAEG
jgi:hypothetical protein